MWGKKCGWSSTYFNSRPSARGDLWLFLLRNNLAISIHAPPRGATAITRWSSTSRDYFNSRPSARGDGVEPVYGEWILTFQFTPLREGRLEEISDKMGALWNISIHAPPRGATRKSCERQLPVYFNSRPSARGDAGTAMVHIVPHYFNSRPSARGDGSVAKRSRRQTTLFQFTPLREGRRKPKTRKRKDGKFQFTPLREGRLHGVLFMPM